MGGNQVSPDLYGDNNTRLFTYWTVSHQEFDPFCHFCMFLQLAYIQHDMNFRNYVGVNICVEFVKIRNGRAMLIKPRVATTCSALALFKSTMR